MLNGIAPILIFTFPLYPKSPAFNALSDVPMLRDFLDSTLSVAPIPIYLDERTTDIYVESETKAIDIETNVQPRFDGKKPIVDQRGLNSLVTINLLAKRDSILLAALLAMIDIIFSKVVSQEYKVSYLNGTTTVFNGLLHGFSTSNGIDDDLLRITLQLSKANQEGTTPANVIHTLPKITGAVPVVAG